jgi:hypothetical protein
MRLRQRRRSYFAALRQQGTRRCRPSVAGIRVTEHALAGARGPSILQFERELQLRFGRGGDHAEVALQPHGQKGNGIDGRRPALVAAAGDPKAVVVQPRIEQLSAYPDRRDAGLDLKRRVARGAA